MLLSLSRFHLRVSMDIERNYDSVPKFSPWRKAVLVFIWSFEVILLALNVIVMGLLIGITKTGSRNEKGGVQLWTIINLVIAGISLIITCTEISIFINRDLTPVIYICAVTLKMVIGLAPVGFQIYVTRTSWIHGSYNVNYLEVGFGFGIVVYLIYITAFTYAIFAQAKLKKRVREVYIN